MGRSEPAVPLGAPPVPLAPATAPPDAPDAIGTGVGRVDALATATDPPEPAQEELVVLLMELLVLVLVASGSGSAV